MTTSEAPVLFFTPFVSSRMAIQPDWIDYNGHLNMAYYHVLFDKALDECFAIIGLGPDYVETHKASYFAAETHTLYKRELHLGDAVRVTVQLIDFDEKRIHYYMELRHAEDGWLAATTENLSLHVDMRTRRVCPFPPDILANLAIMKASHRQMPPPDALGRRIGVKPASISPNQSTSRLLN